jgi:LL-diaminopimelate aminotransferase
VYLDTNVMAGRTGAMKDGRYEGITYLDCTRENGFVPVIPGERVDLVYLCSPKIPPGAVMNRGISRSGLTMPGENGALILFDAAYEVLIRNDDIPHSSTRSKGPGRSP